MNRLRNRLIAAFLASTLLPLAATVAITTTLLDRSLRYATTGEINRLSRTLEATARQFYQRERAALKDDALAGRAAATTFASADAASWPPEVRAFWASGEPERFGLSGAGGDRLEYLRRTDASGVAMYTRDLGGLKMADLSAQLGDAPSVEDLTRATSGAIHAHAAGPARHGVADLGRRS